MYKVKVETSSNNSKQAWAEEYQTQDGFSYEFAEKLRFSLSTPVCDFDEIVEGSDATKPFQKLTSMGRWHSNLMSFDLSKTQLLRLKRPAAMAGKHWERFQRIANVSETDKTVVENQYRLNVKYSKKQATVLQIVFEKALFKSTARRMDKFFQAIMMVSARSRSAMILSEANTVRSVQAVFSYLKIEIGKLILAGADKQSITLELEQGAKEFARIKAANAQRAVAHSIDAQRKAKGMKFGKAPEKLKALSSAFGFAYLAYESALFVQKCNDGKENTFKDYYNFTKVINTGGNWLASFDPKWTKQLPILQQIEKHLSEKTKEFIGAKIQWGKTYVFKPLQAYFMILDA